MNNQHGKMENKSGYSVGEFKIRQIVFNAITQNHI